MICVVCLYKNISAWENSLKIVKLLVGWLDTRLTTNITKSTLILHPPSQPLKLKIVDVTYVKVNIDVDVMFYVYVHFLFLSMCMIMLMLMFLLMLLLLLM